MKTAMQQFKEWYFNPNGLYFPSEVEDKINELLAVEQEQINEAYGDGVIDGDNNTMRDYFVQVYNDKS